MSEILAYSNGKPSVNEAKIAALKNTGMRIGAQAGMIERANEIISAISGKSAVLDQIFAFQPLLSEDGLLPPVIAEFDRKIETKDGAQRIEFAGKTYKILAPARFVRVSPTWRDYLLVGLSADKLAVDTLPEALKPVSSEENAVWDASVRAGWVIGRQQADAILAENTAKLRRDYLGMLKYRMLLKHSMINKPVLAKTAPVVKVSDDEISIGVGVTEIQRRAVMEADQGAWEAN